MVFKNPCILVLGPLALKGLIDTYIEPVKEGFVVSLARERLVISNCIITENYVRFM